MSSKSKTSKHPAQIKKLTAKDMKSVKGGSAHSLLQNTATGKHISKAIIT